jgi:hypothetical protein
MEKEDIYFVTLLMTQVLTFLLAVFQSIKHGHFESSCWRHGIMCCTMGAAMDGKDDLKDVAIVGPLP